MATVRSYTAERMAAIEAASVVDGEVVGDDLILTRYDESTINAGNVRGPTGSPGVSEEDLEDAREIYAPAGTVRFGISATADPGWLLFNQTVVDCETLYPALWAKLPATWKASPNANLPNIANRVLMVAGTTANTAVGGSNSRTLVEVNLPPHVHTIDHDHAAGTTSIQSADHSHTMDHNHSVFSSDYESAAHTHNIGGTTTGESAQHNHISGNGQNFAVADAIAANIPSGSGVLNTFTVPAVVSTTGVENVGHTHDYSGTTTGESAFHTHSVDVPAYSGSTGGISANHTHTFDVAVYSGNTGAGHGESTAFDTTPAHIALTPQIKAH